MSAALSKAAQWAGKNPGTAACAVVGAGGVAIVASPAILMSPLLGLAGFGANGVIGGSIAAGIQAMIGNVAAGSAFATLTSAGMGGYGAATVAAVGQAAGVSAIAGAGVGIALKEKKNDGDEGEEEVNGVDGDGPDDDKDDGNAVVNKP
ncbi:hypothetical protein B0T17DRAFT_519208 [Bombardia bombarda]|uniref:Uncharacterized protein n=1 Tax=Bombardia bombarda TaxID=252184 RepID=A0AA40CFK3_9PEZI|nr:hypothetical protein B0T17DRAFT_519208 [Bombardia bombarda]